MNEQILVVDDDGAIRSTVSLVLRRAGYKVSQARDGAEALAVIREAHEEGVPFDLLVTDMGMPRMSGWQLIESLKGAAMDLPIIVMTGVSDAVLCERVGQLGWGDLLEKPFDLKTMVARVGKILQGKEKRRETGDRRRALTARSLETPLGL